jgi:hypothetical protein
MDHVYVRKQTADTPWRTAAVVAGAIAAIELFILVILGVAFGAKLTSDHAEHAVINATTAAKVEAAAPPATSTETKKKNPNAAPTASLPRGKTSVLVLNGNGIAGAASATALRVKALRYPVAGVGDASRRDFPRTIVMYRPGYQGEAERLARDLDLGANRATPLDGMRPADLGRAKLVLVLGS